MEQSVFLGRLDDYIADFQAILSRFVKTRDAIRIQHGDQPTLQRLVLELRDLLHDALGTNDYSKMVVNAFNEGVSNYFQSSSYASVEQIISIASAVKTRVSGNPSLLAKPAQPAIVTAPPHVLSVPGTVTLSWLFNNVPYKFWLAILGIVTVSFVAGVTAAAKLSLVQQWFGLICRH